MKIQMLEWVRSCPCCGVSYQPVSGFCHNCISQLLFEHARRLSPPNERSYPVKSLFQWNPGQSDRLSLFMRSIKGLHQPGVFQRLAEEFSVKFSGDLPAGRRLIVPAPPKYDGQKDHAFWWSYYLSEAVSAPMVPVLERSNASAASQKHLSFSKRNQTSVRLDPEIWSWVRRNYVFDTLVFADDVVTTGSTARAAFKALGFAKNCEVWAISDRTLLP